MNKYIKELNLDYDPFAPGLPAKVFFEGGERRSLVEEAIQLLHDGSTLIAVTGPLGSGKSTVAREVRRCMGADAVCISISATLFMNQSQFLDAVGNQLPKHKHIAAAPNVETAITRLKQFSAELDLEAQSLVLLVDDAHELGAEVLELIEELVRGSGKSFVRVMLFGERQLNNLLQNTLTDTFQANLVHFELASFTTEDTLEYLQIKMGAAGLSSPLPFSGRIIGEFQNSSNGMPAAINALASDFLSTGEMMVSVNSSVDTDFIPEGKSFNFDAQDHMQFDLDMADEDSEEYSDPESIADIEDEHGESRAAWIGQVLNYRYQIAASALAVVLLVTLLVWNTDAVTTTSSLPVELASNLDSGGVNRIQLSPPLAGAVNEQSSAPALIEPVASSDINMLTSEVVADTASVQVEPATIASTVAASSVQAPIAAVSESNAAATAASGLSAEAPKVAVAKAAEKAQPVSPASAKLSAFEQQLLSYAANSYVIQVLGSHSEANVQKFIAGKAIAEPLGYYETRHENKPWFVVLAGNYRDRAAANTVVDKLPSALRDMSPWIRPVGDIQRDLRQLNKL